MLLTFDHNGHLTPHQPIPSNLEELEACFVQPFMQSNTRNRLFVNFLRYLERFKRRVSRHFTVWMDGSFVTQKETPNDLDFVIFLDYRIYELQEGFLDQFWTFSLEAEGLDAYLVKNYPASHPDYEAITVSQTREWLYLYGNTAKNEEGISYPKGFVELIFK